MKIHPVYCTMQKVFSPKQNSCIKLWRGCCCKKNIGMRLTLGGLQPATAPTYTHTYCRYYFRLDSPAAGCGLSQSHSLDDIHHSHCNCVAPQLRRWFKLIMHVVTVYTSHEAYMLGQPPLNLLCVSAFLLISKGQLCVMLYNCSNVKMIGL